MPGMAGHGGVQDGQLSQRTVNRTASDSTIREVGGMIRRNMFRRFSSTCMYCISYVYHTSSCEAWCIYPRSRTTIVFNSLYRTTIVLLRVLHYKARSTILNMVFDFQGIYIYICFMPAMRNMLQDMLLIPPGRARSSQRLRPETKRNHDQNFYLSFWPADGHTAPLNPSTAALSVVKLSSR